MNDIDDFPIESWWRPIPESHTIGAGEYGVEWERIEAPTEETGD